MKELENFVERFVDMITFIKTKKIEFCCSRRAVIKSTFKKTT